MRGRLGRASYIAITTRFRDPGPPPDPPDRVRTRPVLHLEEPAATLCAFRARRGISPAPSPLAAALRALENFSGVDANSGTRPFEHLQLPDVRLVAQSMGGWTCLEYVLKDPRKVRALVLTLGHCKPTLLTRAATSPANGRL